MKKLVFSISIALSSLTYAGADVDFSKAYVVPEKSGVDTVTIGGVKPLWSELFYSVDFSLNSEYTLNMLGVLNQSSVQEQLEQSLRNTTWVGKYLIGNSNYSTTLKFVVVQDGYVGGEVIHSEPEEDGGGYLHARVTGDILSQYEVGDSFIDEDRLTPEVLENISPETITRQLIRIKRVRALEFKDGNNGSWGINREYRFILENGMLSGAVGTLNNLYGSGDATSENGNILLTLQN
ncbi:MAG: hypothetical protein QM487_01440 [Candidatus Marithrix sp.]